MEESNMTQGRRLQFACRTAVLEADMSTHQIRLFRKKSDGPVMHLKAAPSPALVIVSRSDD